MYMKPSKEQIEVGIELGWDREICERGYDIFDCNGTGLLEINRIDDIYVGWGEDGTTEVTDEDCAREAERSGFCKIIPVKELPKKFEYRYFGWIDTPENRENIAKYAANRNCGRF